MVAVISLLEFCSAGRKWRTGKVVEHCGMLLILAGGQPVCNTINYCESHVSNLKFPVNNTQLRWRGFQWLMELKSRPN